MATRSPPAARRRAEAPPSREAPSRARKPRAGKPAAEGRSDGSADMLRDAAGTPRRDMSRMAKMLTPEQAIELYKANARMALDVINAAIESTAKLRRLQFEGEEQAREMQQEGGASRGRGEATRRR